MSQGLYSHTTRATGTILTAAIYNADHVNHITNQNPSMTGALSDTLTEYRSTADPGGSGSEILSGSLAGELQRLRYVINRIVGKTYWYEAPASSLETLGDPDLAAIAALAGTSGGLYKTAANTWALRTLQAGTGVSITNPAGVAGDPSIGLTDPVAMSPPGGRLSLTTATPVLAADVTSAGTIFYVPYRGLFVPLYDGSVTRMTSIGSERSLVLDSNAGHAGYHQSGKNFDLYIYNDGGTIRLVTGAAWTNDTTRAESLAYQNGWLTNSGTITGRFGTGAGDTVSITAGKGLYVGSFRASADGITQWVAQPAAAAGGGNCQLLLWNAYNRVPVSAISRDSTNSWNYTTLTWRAANNNNANRISALVGLNEEPVTAAYHAAHSVGNGAAARYGFAGVGLDSTSAISGATAQGSPAQGNDIEFLVARYSGFLGLGYHFIQALEQATAVDTHTFYGDNNAPTSTQTGLFLDTRM